MCKSSSEPENGTSYTLLDRALNLNDNEAWQVLLDEYSNFIHYILNTFRLTAADRDDVVQLIAINLTKHLDKYDQSVGRFRPWFARMIHNQCLLYLRQNRLHKRRVDAAGEHEVIFDQSSESELEQRIIDEWEVYIVNKALENVRPIFSGVAVEVFEMALDGWSTAEICQKYSITEGSVYTLKRRVRKELMLEVDRLTRNLEPKS